MVLLSGGGTSARLDAGRVAAPGRHKSADGRHWREATLQRVSFRDGDSCITAPTACNDADWSRAGLSAAGGRRRKWLKFVDTRSNRCHMSELNETIRLNSGEITAGWRWSEAAVAAEIVDRRRIITANRVETPPKSREIAAATSIFTLSARNHHTAPRLPRAIRAEAPAIAGGICNTEIDDFHPSEASQTSLLITSKANPASEAPIARRERDARFPSP